ncbi:MAG: winged helix DNA-binding protein [Candidatus Nanohalobium sp.]
MTDTEELFLHTKPAKILIHLNNPSRDNYPSQIAQDVDSTYSHTARTINRLEDHNLAQSHRKGRRKQVELTEQGKKTAETLSTLIHQLRQLD